MGAGCCGRDEGVVVGAVEDGVDSEEGANAEAARINRDVCEIADRLWVKDELDPEEEKLRFSK
jgi:sugar phosphate isomerase/epimerase